MIPGILAIDIGTSSCKAAVFSLKGDMLALGKGRYSLLFPKEGYAEQKPDEIYQGVCEAVCHLERQGIELSEIQAISFSAQIAAQCLVDSRGKAVTNLISWMDMRAWDEALEFTQKFSKEETEYLTGVDMVVTPAYSIAKLRWLHNHERGLLEMAARFVQIKDYVIYHLTGCWVSDAASLKGLVHAETGKAVPEIMTFIGESPELLPKVKKPYEIAGYLKKGVRGFEQLPAGIPVIVGWNDMNAAFLGMGALTGSCIGMDLTGTSEHLGCVTLRKRIEQKAYEGLNRVPFLDGREVFYGVTSSGGQAVEWFVKDMLGEPDVKAYFERLFERPKGLPLAEEQGPIFLPYLEGERNPWNNRDARGVFFGLNRSHRQPELALSVLEGVCFALRTIYDRLPQLPEKVVISGGASFNEVWNQMKADVMNVPFVRLETSEAGCTGAAIMAIAALHPKKTVEELAGGLFRPAKVYWPDQKRHLIYEKKYQSFLRLYHNLEPLFGKQQCHNEEEL